MAQYQKEASPNKDITPNSTDFGFGFLCFVCCERPSKVGLFPILWFGSFVFENYSLSGKPGGSVLGLCILEMGSVD